MTTTDAYIDIDALKALIAHSNDFDEVDGYFVKFLPTLSLQERVEFITHNFGARIATRRDRRDDDMTPEQYEQHVLENDYRALVHMVLKRIGVNY